MNLAHGCSQKRSWMNLSPNELAIELETISFSLGSFLTELSFRLEVPEASSQFASAASSIILIIENYNSPQANTLCVVLASVSLPDV